MFIWQHVIYKRHYKIEYNVLHNYEKQRDPKKQII